MKRFRNGDELSSTIRKQTYYDILGIPTGAGIDHIKASYRLLATKTVFTEAAYRALTDPEKRRQYDAWMLGGFKPEAEQRDAGGHTKVEQDWGKRGRERCSCGKVLQPDDEWHCQECWGKLEYYVVFDMFGGYVVHDSQMPIVTEPDGQTYQRAPYGTLYGPFPKEEAEVILKEKSELRKK